MLYFPFKVILWSSVLDIRLERDMGMVGVQSGGFSFLIPIFIGSVAVLPLLLLAQCLNGWGFYFYLD